MSEGLKGKSVLVTGGAGFIGSNLVEALLNIGAKVSVFDNLETGKRTNLTEFDSNESFSFIEGDIRNYEACLQAMKGIDLISGADDREFFIMPDIGGEIAKLQKLKLETEEFLSKKDEWHELYS